MIVRELDGYHGFAAAERLGFPDASEALEAPEDREVMAQLVDRIRQTVLEEIERGKRMARETPDPQDMA